MTFEGQYLTYQEYQDLGGSAIGETPFNLLEFEARKQIDLRTQLRLKKIDTQDIPLEVKICETNLINKIKSYSENTIEINSNKANESIDGYSVSFFTPDQVQQVVKLHKDELDNIMLNDLYGVVVNNVAIIYNGAN